MSANVCQLLYRSAKSKMLHWQIYSLYRLRISTLDSDAALRLCHDYIITILSPTFLSYLSHLFAYELPRSNGIYLCITTFFASVLSTCQHLSVPTPLFPHKQKQILK